MKKSQTQLLKGEITDNGSKINRRLCFLFFVSGWQRIVYADMGGTKVKDTYFMSESMCGGVYKHICICTFTVSDPDVEECGMPAYIAEHALLSSFTLHQWISERL